MACVFGLPLAFTFYLGFTGSWPTERFVGLTNYQDLLAYPA